jgi:hypothetical protein
VIGIETNKILFIILYYYKKANSNF